MGDETKRKNSIPIQVFFCIFIDSFLRDIPSYLRHLLGPAVGRYPIKFVSYLGERGMLCVRNGCHFCTPVLMVMCNITFEAPRLGTFVFKKSSEKKIFKNIIIRG